MSSGRGSPAPLMLLRVAWRNLWRRRRRTLITLSSIAIGFGLAVFTIGISDGTYNSMVRNAIRLGEGHLTIQPAGYFDSPANHKYIAGGTELGRAVEALGVEGRVDPRVSLRVLASTPHNSTGAGLEGLDPDSDRRAEVFRPLVVEGGWIEQGDETGVVIGDGMARRLKAGVGGKVVLMAGSEGGDSQAHLARVRGIFDTGLDELDDFMVLSDIGLARRFLEGEGADPGKGPVTRVAVNLNDPDAAAGWKLRLAGSLDLGGAELLDWQEMMPELVQLIALDSAGHRIFLALILVMVVFGVVNTALMSVLERTREFGLLRALGLGRGSLLLLVGCETLLMSLLAVLAGWIVGGGTHLWFAYNGISLADMVGGDTSIGGTFMDPVTYSELSWERVAELTAIVFGATFATGLYPAIKAARVAPVEALRT